MIHRNVRVEYVDGQLADTVWPAPPRPVSRGPEEHSRSVLVAAPQIVVE
jgi:hypothetical protein